MAAALVKCIAVYTYTRIHSERSPVAAGGSNFGLDPGIGNSSFWTASGTWNTSGATFLVYQKIGFP